MSDEMSDKMSDNETVVAEWAPTGRHRNNCQGLPKSMTQLPYENQMQRMVNDWNNILSVPSKSTQKALRLTAIAWQRNDHTLDNWQYMLTRDQIYEKQVSV